jgi:cysteine sulfinate desulfinase/cysteine desulfurase-like protein
MAMGRDEVTARATIRFSLGRSTTGADLEDAVKALADVVAGMKR